MKRGIGLVMVCCFLLSPVLVGCTAPTQVIAENALQKAKDEDHKIINDLALRAKQSAIEIMRYKVYDAVEKQSTEDADSAMLAFMNELDKIHFMQITHERALRLTGMAERYIWEQKGWLDILLEEWEQAEKIAEEKAQPEPK